MIIMAECFKCGVSDKKAQLFDVITKEGIVKMCDRCSRLEDSPILRKPTIFQLKELERRPTVYERLARAAGLDPKEKKVEKTESLLKQETTLRAIVDKNYQEKVKQEAKPRPDLIDNFHWMIMRTRRSKHITQKQLAEAIGEAEAAIKMAEEGVLPENNYLLNKIQNYLGINLFKDGNKIIAENPAPVTTPPIIFDRKNPNNLTISDLKKIKEAKENRSGVTDLKEAKKSSKRG